MMNHWATQGLQQRIAYLRGLAKGMKVDDRTAEGSLFSSILDVLDDMALTIDELNARQEELDEYVTCIDEDLSNLEEIDEDDDDEWLELDIPGEEVEVITEGMEDSYLLEIECPHCHDDFDLDSEAFDEHNELQVTCPSCRQILMVEAPEMDDWMDHV